MPCPGRRTDARRLTIPPITGLLNVPGSIGMLKLRLVNETERVDVYGDVTDVKYPFSKMSVLWVDVRDPAFLLGKDFILADGS